MTKSDSLRVMTLNIAHGRGLSTYQGFHSRRGIEKNISRIAELISREAPDLVALQEVDSDSHWNKRVHLLEGLKEQTGFQYGFLGVHNRRRSGRLSLAYGNGVLSRHEITSASCTPFGSAELGEKGFTWTEIVLGCKILPFINLHLDFRSKRRRIEQVEILLNEMRNRMRKAGPEKRLPLICGDFNAKRGRKVDAVDHLLRCLRNEFEYRSLPEKGGRSFPSLLPLHAIDYIFVPPSFGIQGCWVPRSYVSDHRPILADLTFGFLGRI